MVVVEEQDIRIKAVLLVDLVVEQVDVKLEVDLVELHFKHSQLAVVLGTKVEI